MQKTSVYLPEELKGRLSEHAQASGRSEAELIRSSIEHYLLEHRLREHRLTEHGLSEHDLSEHDLSEHGLLAADSTREPETSADVIAGSISNIKQSSFQTPSPGRLVGVGVGPGPADMVTVGALAALRRADRVIAPCISLDAVGRAETIVRQAAPEVTVERLKFVMAADHEARASALVQACDTIVSYLNNGDEVAFITLGDPNTYSTVSNVIAGTLARRPNTPVETIPGIMAFQALAAAANITVTDEQQTLVLVPASAPTEVIERELADDTRTVIFYKGGGRIGEVAAQLARNERLDTAVLGELLGMNGQQIEPVARVADRPASYLSTVISPAKEGLGPTR